MSYDYGSQSLDIKNPFKFQGLMILIRGIITLLLSIYSLLKIQDLVKVNQDIVAWVYAIIGIFLLSWSIKSIISGFFQIFRLYTGRNIPADLCNDNLARSINSNKEISKEKAFYNYEKIHNMLLGRKNSTFDDPNDVITKSLFGIFPKLLFSARPYRILLELIYDEIIISIFCFLGFILSWFLMTTGLLKVNSSLILPWLSLILLFVLLFHWRRVINSSENHYINIYGWGICIILVSIFLPFLLNNIFQEKLIRISVINTFYPILLIILCIILTSFLTFFLILQRVNSYDYLTNVSEHRDSWQYNIAPKEIFTYLSTHVLANRRYKEMPNREYSKFDPKAIQEGGYNKGSFSGFTLVETQPRPKDIDYSNLFINLRYLTTIIAQVFLLISALLLVFNVHNFVKINIDYSNIIYIAYSLIFFIFGSILHKVSNLFWGETNFESTLFDLKLEGTYTEAKISSGKSIYDSTSSENNVIYSSITPWFILCNVQTVTFANSKKMDLLNTRYILSFDQSNNELKEIISELENFFNSRENIVGVNNVDLESAGKIYQMNKQTVDNRLKNIDKNIEEQAYIKKIKEDDDD